MTGSVWGSGCAEREEVLRNDAGWSPLEARNWGLRFEPSPDCEGPSLSLLCVWSEAGQGAGSFPASDQDFILQQCVCGWTPDTRAFGEG